MEDVQSIDGVWWYDAPLPPLEHECWAQSSGWIGLTLIVRCPCGAVRRNGRTWFDQNTRRP